LDLFDLNCFCPETNRLLFGFREKDSVSVDPRALPEKMTGYLFNQDPNGWGSLLKGIPDFEIYLPIIEELGISSYIKGFLTTRHMATLYCETSRWIPRCHRVC